MPDEPEPHARNARSWEDSASGRHERKLARLVTERAAGVGAAAVLGLITSLLLASLHKGGKHVSPVLDFWLIVSACLVFGLSLGYLLYRAEVDRRAQRRSETQELLELGRALEHFQ